MKFCKKCVQMSFSKPKVEFVVVLPPRREVLKAFNSFHEARQWARDNAATKLTGRVEEREVGSECALCGDER